MTVVDHNRTLSPITIGLIVNPTAGVGGPAGLKGSDDRVSVAKAIASGVEVRASLRAERCLARLATLPASLINVLTCPAPMGAIETSNNGLATKVLARSATFFHDASSSCSEDTRHAAAEMLAAGVDLLLFAGGDGTARDICSVIADKIPVLGIPAGVKMHSGVFALSPETAAEIVIAMMMGDLVSVRLQEVRDIDEAALRNGVVNSRYFGEMRVPDFGGFLQASKSGGREDETLVLNDMAAFVREMLEPDTLYFVGAGTTTQALMSELRLPGTLLGVDVVYNEELLAVDVSAAELEDILDHYGSSAVIIISVTGGQGALIGRGNQQFSPSLLRRVGRDRVWALATKTKIKQLQGRPLLLDSNDPLLDQQWQGFITVITGYQDQILYPLGVPLNVEAESE